MPEATLASGSGTLAVMAFDLDDYVRVHLAYEMKYLLVAATKRRGPACDRRTQLHDDEC